ncbi:MAG: type VII secretion protein EccB [Mycobacteriaceae bacterium]|nr:type VII secretion protein EccB [Mycobacteriaceae bacterium]
MPARLTTKPQVSGYRFLLRRLEHAMVRRDVRMLHDPMRAQLRSLTAGLVLGVLAVAGMAILGFLKPEGTVGEAKIVTGKDSGALYVVVEGRLHPALNLASARLISGTAEGPTSVKDSKLRSMPRGAMLGIPGAPAALPGPASPGNSQWTVCESVMLSASGSALASQGVTTAVLAGPAPASGARAMAANEALLATHKDHTYLLYRGKRAEVDLKNPVVARTLRLSGLRPRPVGAALMDALAAAPALEPPAIPQAGKPGKGRLAGVKVGTVIRTDGLAGSELYVVVADGVQRISPLAAEMIRNADSQGRSTVETLPPDTLTGVPVVRPLPVDEFPVETPKVLAAEQFPVSCVTWRKTTDAPAAIAMMAGGALPLPASAKPVALAGADGVGDQVDESYLPPSSGEYIQATGIAPGSARRDSLFFVADNGIRYGVPDRETAAVLGLPAEPVLAPWAIVGRLVPGPTLRRSAALVSRDTLPAVATE